MNLLAFLMILSCSDDDVERLRVTAPSYLTTESAREHLGSARLAGSLTQIDPAILLSIAHHESRYSMHEVTQEQRGKASCGVMTPQPLATCRPAQHLWESYLEGARHLRQWLTAARGSTRYALTGYAGGYHLINYCLYNDHKNCDVADVFLRRASAIRGH